MKIAITGASGNLGQRVTRIALDHGHTVVGIDKAASAQTTHDDADKHARFRHIELDVRQYDQVLEALRGNDAVIHLAAIPNPGDYVVESHNLNVVASWNVLRAAAELGIERICQASSINAVGLVWGDNPLIDYLPLDENHPCRPEDPYSLSKLVCELQANTIIRRWPNMRIASIRLAWAVPNREYAMGRDMDWVRKELWAWVDADESARAFVLGVTAGDWKGHEPFFIVAPNTCQDEPTMELVNEHWPSAIVTKEIVGCEGLYDCSKAERILGWKHAMPSTSPVLNSPTSDVVILDAPVVVVEETVTIVDIVPAAEEPVEAETAEPAAAPAEEPTSLHVPAPEPASEVPVAHPEPAPAPETSAAAAPLHAVEPTPTAPIEVSA